MRLTYTLDQRRHALELAAKTGSDWRTALKAILHGPDAIRTRELSLRLAHEMRLMGIPTRKPRTAA
jgi:hypothetical protein